MFSKETSYVIAPKNIKDNDLESVGREAIFMSKLHNLNVPVIDSFVITTKAFNDFINSNNLAPSILEQLNTIGQFDRISAEKASKNIQKLILNAKFPTIILKPIESAFRQFYKGGSTHIELLQSNVIDKNFIHTKPSSINSKVDSYEGLFDLIRSIWAEFFNTESLELRVNNYFKGTLTLAVIVQKPVNAEISGRYYSVPPITEEENKSQIDALYGLRGVDIMQENEYDIYKIDKTTHEITEQTILPQKHMYLRSKNSNNPHLKIEISDEWKTKQKLHESYVKQIYNYCIQIEQVYKSNIIAWWSIQAGELFFESITAQKMLPKIGTSPEDSVINSMDIEEEYFKKVTEKKLEEKKSPKPNIPELTEEILDLTQNNSEIVNKEIQELETPKIQKKYSDKWLKQYNLVTKMYLNISKLNPQDISNLKYLDGGFVDGTEIVLSHNLLAEELHLQPDIAKLVENYSLDISTAARSSENKEVIYQFSDIGEWERKLLGAKLESFYGGDERFIENPLSIATEANALRKSRNVNNLKNLSVSIPGIRSEHNLIDIKKILLSQNIRRTKSLKIYCELSMPSFLFELNDLENSIVDGVIINFDKLLQISFNRSNSRTIDLSIGLKNVKFVMDSLKGKSIEVLVRFRNYDKELLKEVLHTHPTGFIFDTFPEEEIAKIIEEYESEHIRDFEIHQPKKGRKIKPLF